MQTPLSPQVVASKAETPTKTTVAPMRVRTPNTEMVFMAGPPTPTTREIPSNIGPAIALLTDHHHFA